MRKIIIILILIFFTQIIFITNLYAVNVEVYALEAMPYCGIVNYKPSGIAIEILNEATKYGAPNFIFNFDVPWLRAQVNIQEADDKLVAIIPFSRIAQREDHYKWITELFPTQSCFFSYGRKTPLNSINDAKYITIGVVRGHALIPRLKELGIRLLDEDSPNAEFNAIKLLKKRYDTIADSDLICLYNWKKIGQKTEDLQIGPAIGDITSVCIAGNLNFPDDVAKHISDAIEKMRKDGKLEEILNQWK